MANVCIETRIQDNSHGTNCFAELQTFWQSEQFCDLTLKVAKMEFKVHKLILMSCSRYFKNMFTQELFVENHKNYIELRQVDPNAFSVILEYFYSGYVVLSETTVERVLATADFFSLTAVKSICIEYLLNHIDINNCISRYSMGVTFELSDLERQTKSFIVDKLDEVSETLHFQNIDQATLRALLTTTKRNSNGEQIYFAIIKWIKFNFDKRKRFLPDLLDLIPIENISYEFYLNSMKNDEILRQDFKYLSWLLDNFADRFDKLYVGATSLLNSLFITSRMDASECFQLDLKNGVLNSLPDLPEIERFSAVSYKKSIFITAGERNFNNLKKSYKYNIHQSSWLEKTLCFQRRSAGVCVLRDYLFIVGGYDSRDKLQLNSCIYYDFNSNYKFMLAGMKKKRCLPGIGVYQNSVYVSCGWDGESNLSCIERYDLREGIWKNVGTYNFASGQSSSTVISNFLYTSDQSDSLVQRFDFRNNTSEKLATPGILCNYRNWMTSAQGKLFRIYETGLSEYDFINNQWLHRENMFTLQLPFVTAWDSV